MKLRQLHLQFRTHLLQAQQRSLFLHKPVISTSLRQLQLRQPFATMTVPEHLLADQNAPITRLDIKPHFEALSEKEKLYAHYISR